MGEMTSGGLARADRARPRGAPHRYFLKLYALDAKVNLKAGASGGRLNVL